MLLFSKKKLAYGFEILHGILTHKKRRFEVKTNSGDNPCPQGVDFLGFFSRKKQKVLREN
jgi:hypothetical protein